MNHNEKTGNREQKNQMAIAETGRNLIFMKTLTTKFYLFNLMKINNTEKQATKQNKKRNTVFKFRENIQQTAHKKGIRMIR